jgi:hypothetical protein
MDLRRKIDGVDVIANDTEIWFVQDEKICWTTMEDLWVGSQRLSRILREKGYRIHTQRFPKKLKELTLALSK